MADDEDGSEGKGIKIAKGVLMGLGGLVALGFVISVLKPLIFVGMIGGAGYLGYKLLTRNKALGDGSSERKALTSGSDYDRKMRELEDVERRLDREIGKR